MSSTIIGLDIGGANLKAALPDGSARSRPFELWKYPDLLGKTLQIFLEGWEPSQLAVTMTGELCDCFETKRDGVRRILAEVERAFPDSDIRIWSTAGQFVSLEEARQDHLKAAAANWHALATLAANLLCKSVRDDEADLPTFLDLPDEACSALMIDVGTTTTDVIPLWQGRPMSVGLCDPQRLKSKELIYTGVKRTPICALLHDGIMAECFATSHDAYLRLGLLPDAPEDHHTCDGRPATAKHAHGRLARMLGGDSDITPIRETDELARRVFKRQRALLAEAIRINVERLPEPPQAVILFGSGEFLARAAWNDYLAEQQVAEPVRIVSLSEMLDPAVSTAACAYAVAVLAEEACLQFQ